MSGVTADGLHDAEVETRWEAAPAVLLIIALQALLAAVSYRQNWHLWNLPWWAWLSVMVPEALLFARSRGRVPDTSSRNREAPHVLAVAVRVISLGNGVRSSR